MDFMLTPGAVTSGLSPLSPLRGPPDVNVARPLVAGVRGDAGIGHRDRRAVRREQARARRQGHAEERDLDDPAVPRDRALQGRQRVGVVDHDHGGRAGRLTEDGPIDAGAHASKCDDDVTGLHAGVVGGGATERDAAGAIAEHAERAD